MQYSRGFQAKHKSKIAIFTELRFYPHSVSDTLTAWCNRSKSKTVAVIPFYRVKCNSICNDYWYCPGVHFLRHLNGRFCDYSAKTFGTL